MRTIEELTAQYGYGRIQTPGFEDTALFARTAGEASDVVHKEMYTFTDRSDRSLTLRPEGTAPIARAYIQHGLHKEPQPVKAFTIAPMYRYGAPGRGRYREHWQLSVEAIGSADPAVDAEVIQLYHELLRRLGVTKFELLLNSIGDAACRPAYVEKLTAWLDAHPDALDDEARHKLATSPLQVFDVKTPHVRAALADAPKIGDSLCDACRAHFDDVRRFLDGYGVPYTLEPSLVRGLDYYARTTWEFVGPDENANSTISGGGRYDGLVEAVGGPPAPGVGFGAGLERLVLALENEGRLASPAPPRRLLRARRGSAARPRSPDPGRGAQSRAQRRHRLRGPLVQGADDPGGPNRRPFGRDRPRGRRSGSRRGSRAGGGARRARRYAHCPMNAWRDLPGSKLRPGDEGRTLALAGWVARRRDLGGLIFVDLRDEGGIVQLVINPEHAPAAAELAKELRNEFVIRARGDVVKRAAEHRQREHRHGRDRGAGHRARDPQPVDAAAVPARRGGRRRDAADPLPVARPAPRAAAAEHPHCAPRRSRSSARRWRPTASSTSRRRSWASPRPRARATSSSRPGCSPGGSSRCRRARRSTSSSS